MPALAAPRLAEALNGLEAQLAPGGAAERLGAIVLSFLLGMHRRVGA